MTVCERDKPHFFISFLGRILHSTFIVLPTLLFHNSFYLFKINRWFQYNFKCLLFNWESTRPILKFQFESWLIQMLLAKYNCGSGVINCFNNKLNHFNYFSK